MLAPSLRPSSLARPIPRHVGRSRIARIRPSRNRQAPPVQAIFGLGNRSGKSASQKEKMAELDEGIQALIKGTTVGPLSGSKQEKLDELLEETASFRGRNIFKEAEGDYEIVYFSRRLFPAFAVKNSARLSIKKGGIWEQEGNLGLFGVIPIRRVLSGPMKPVGPTRFDVTWEESTFERPFGSGEDPSPGIGRTAAYDILYCSGSLFIVTSQSAKNVGKEEPVLIICERIAQDDDEERPSNIGSSATGQKRISGLATRAERKYKQQVSEKVPEPSKKLPKSGNSEEEPKKKSSGLFGGFFAPPRYPDADDDDAEPTRQGSRKVKQVAKSVKENPAQAKRAAAAKAKADAAAAAKAEAEKKAAAAAKAKADAAAKAKAEAEKAVALKKKEQLDAYLKQLADDLKVAQQEAKASSEALRNATRENSATVKEAQTASKKIEAAEASVQAVEEDIEDLSLQEQEIGEKLRNAQRELQQLRD